MGAIDDITLGIDGATGVNSLLVNGGGAPKRDGLT
jgi:hypothetical protein